MKFIKALAPVAAAAVLAFAPLASQAGLVVYLDDGNALDRVMITDGLTGDNAPGIPGLISFSVVNFNGYTIVGSIASASDNPLDMHLTASVSGFGGQSPITIYAGFNDITSNGSLVSLSGGGSGPGSASWAAYADATNKQFFQTGSSPSLLFQQVGYTTAATSVSASLTNPFAMTLAASFDYSALAPRTSLYSSSLDLNLTVPEPTSIALVGLALLGLGLSQRRKAKIDA